MSENPPEKHTERWSWDAKADLRLAKLYLYHRMWSYRKSKKECNKWDILAEEIYQGDSRKETKAPPDGGNLKVHIKDLISNILFFKSCYTIRRSI